MSALTADGGENLLVRREGAVLVLTLHRPHRRNALDAHLAAALLAELGPAPGPRGVRCVLLTGAGTAFCSGDDRAAAGPWRAGDYSGTPNDPRTHEHLYLSLCRRMLEMPVPVVVAVNGPAVGAGLSLVCAADFRIAAAGATFATPALRQGHVGDAALLARAVGPSRATALYLSGRPLDAREAAVAGLLDLIVPDGELALTAMEFATELAAAPTDCVAAFKALRERVWHAPTDTALLFQDRAHHRAHAVADRHPDPLETPEDAP